MCDAAVAARSWEKPCSRGQGGAIRLNALTRRPGAGVQTGISFVRCQVKPTVFRPTPGVHGQGSAP